MQTNRMINEDDFQYKLRLCRAKLNGDIDLDWQEIVDLLGLNVHYDHLRKTAYGLIEYDNYQKSSFGVATRILCISDLHVPFQKPKETFADYIGRVDILVINGDVSDCQAISKFPKAYRVSPMEEIIKTWQYLFDLILYINPKRVIVNYGNHDVRFQNYLAKNLDTDILELMPMTSLELILCDGFTHYNKRTKVKTEYPPLTEVVDGIEIEYTNNWHCQVGQTIFCHPSTFSSQIMKTSENAMSFFRNEGYSFTSIVTAHTHRLGEYTVGNTVLYEQGCCCETAQLNYLDGKLTKSQKEGFIYIAQNADGKLIKEKTQLVCLN